MIRGKKKSLKGALYVKKPHFCPDCKTQLEAITVSKVAKTTEEARRYDHSSNRGLPVGGKNVAYSWYELKCPSCSRQISVEEMKKIEYAQMDAEALQAHERKEKRKVFAFKMLFFLFIALMLLVYILSRP